MNRMHDLPNILLNFNWLKTRLQKVARTNFLLHANLDNCLLIYSYGSLDWFSISNDLQKSVIEC